MADHIIDLKGIGRRVTGRGGAPMEILSGVDFRVGAGEFVALVGPSGCGKSTLLNIISGLVPATAGTVNMFGETLSGIHPRVGYMFQTDALLPWLSVQKNVELGLELQRVGPRERADRARAMLAQLGLAGYEEYYPVELSGGMRQRVSLARTWVTDPEVLLMDEPFGALDGQTKLLIQELFISFWEQHRKTVLFVTHDLQEAVTLSDRVVVMAARPGRIKAEYRIDLPRPRSLMEARSDPRFVAYWNQIWEDIRHEATQAMQGVVGHAG